jgi:hypothetical protein
MPVSRELPAQDLVQAWPVSWVPLAVGQSKSVRISGMNMVLSLVPVVPVVRVVPAMEELPFQVVLVAVAQHTTQAILPE